MVNSTVMFKVALNCESLGAVLTGEFLHARGMKILDVLVQGPLVLKLTAALLAREF